VLDRSFGLDQGFAHYDTPSQVKGRGRGKIGLYDERPGTEVVAAASAWLRELDRGSRFLAWVHLFDPHAPYAPPAAARERAGGNAYLGEVAAMDDAVATLVATLRDLGQLDDTLILVVGDHGEGLGEHDEATHGVFCYDSTLHVPFLIRYPEGHGAGERRGEPVSVADVYPTLIEALGLDDAGDVDGSSLYRREAPAGRGIYFESFYGTIHYGWAPLVGWVDADGKYIHGQPGEFFDTYADPRELAAMPDDFDATGYLDRIAAVLSSDALGAEGDIDTEMLSRLQALGYVTAGSGGGLALPDPLAPYELPNPRSRHEEAERLGRGITTLQRGQIDEAIAIFESIVEDNPRNAAAIEFMAPAMIENGRCNDAVPLLERLIEAGVERALTHLNLGRCLESDGRTEDALAQFRIAAELEPGNKTVLRMLASLLDRLGHDKEGAEVLGRLEALDG
jgi:tetratricopeptide (TPR) repeat protein